MKPLVPIVFLASLCVWESVRFTFVAKVAEMKFYKCEIINERYADNDFYCYFCILRSMYTCII